MKISPQLMSVRARTPLFNQRAGGGTLFQLALNKITRAFHDKQSWEILNNREIWFLRFSPKFNSDEYLGTLFNSISCSMYSLGIVNSRHNNMYKKPSSAAAIDVAYRKFHVTIHIYAISLFQGAPTHLYERLCLSVSPPVRHSRVKNRRKSLNPLNNSFSIVVVVFNIIFSFE